MAETNIDLSFYENEDADRSFTLKSGNATSAVAYDLTGVEFFSQIRDQKGALVLALSTGDEGGITITDAPNGKFALHISQGSIPYSANRSLRYDLLMHDANGETRRLFGGSVRVSQGVSVSPGVTVP